MIERYPIVDKDAKLDSKELASFLANDGQLLLPMLELVEQAQCAIDELVRTRGRDGAGHNRSHSADECRAARRWSSICVNKSWRMTRAVKGPFFDLRFSSQ